MRRYSLILTALALAMLLMAGLTWAEEAKTCQKSTTATAVGCEKKCAAEKACAKTEGLSSADAGKQCAVKKGGSGMGGCKSSSNPGEKGCDGMGGCKSSGGCGMMMTGGPGPDMMDMHHGMMGRGGWSGRGHGRKMGLRSHRPGGPEYFLHRAEKLELTEKQLADLKALKWDHEKSAIEMRAEIETARVDMKQLLDQKTLNFGKIKAKASQIADMHKKMQLARWSVIEKSHGLLTAEQLEKAKELGKKRSGTMKGSRQMIKKMIIEKDEE